MGRKLRPLSVGTNFGTRQPPSVFVLHLLILLPLRHPGIQHFGVLLDRRFAERMHCDAFPEDIAQNVAADTQLNGVQRITHHLLDAEADDFSENDRDFRPLYNDWYDS